VGLSLNARRGGAKMDAVFNRALQKIPPQLRERPGTRFTVIINGQKKPEGKDWPDIYHRIIIMACSVVMLA
jgi:hypothetical protein